MYVRILRFFWILQANQVALPKPRRPAWEPGQQPDPSQPAMDLSVPSSVRAAPGALSSCDHGARRECVHPRPLTTACSQSGPNGKWTAPLLLEQVDYFRPGQCDAPGPVVSLAKPASTQGTVAKPGSDLTEADLPRGSALRWPNSVSDNPALACGWMPKPPSDSCGS